MFGGQPLKPGTVASAGRVGDSRTEHDVGIDVQLDIRAKAVIRQWIGHRLVEVLRHEVAERVVSNRVGVEERRKQHLPNPQPNLVVSNGLLPVQG